jgi:hypothetical protein
MIHALKCPFYSSPSLINESQRLTARVPLVDDAHSIPNMLDHGGKYDVVDEQWRTIEVEVLKAVVKEGVCWACEREQRRRV